MKQLQTPVIYLETTDLDSTRIKGHHGKGILLVQGDFCGFCTTLKPHYQQLAQEMFPYHFFTIQVDSTRPGEQGFSDGALVNTFVQDNIQGIPYLRKVINGKVSGPPFQGDPASIDQLRAWIQN